MMFASAFLTRSSGCFPAMSPAAKQVPSILAPSMRYVYDEKTVSLYSYSRLSYSLSERGGGIVYKVSTCTSRMIKVAYK